MIFVEYIRRRPGIPDPIASYHASQDWASPEDVLFANLVRTMKLGPEPTQMCWWQISGFDRIDAWERYLKSEAGRLYRAESPVPLALDFYQFGMFDLVCGKQPAAGKLHIVEFFDVAALNPTALGRALETRRRRYDSNAGINLTAVITRIGKIGPNPGGIAVWSADTYTAAEPLLRDMDGHDSMHVADAGLYRVVGEEIP